MVVVMKERATEAQIDAVIARLIELGMDVHRSSGVTRTVLGVVGAHKIDPRADRDPRRRARGAADHRALQARQPHLQAGGHGRHDRRRADRRRRGDRHGRAVLGGDRRAGARRLPRRVKRAGAKILRGGAFKPRSSPYSFQGLGEAGLQMLRARPTRTT